MNCSSASDGGAIYFSVSGGSVGDCSFVGCSASGGGAIYFGGSGGSSSVGNCSFVNCSANYGDDIFLLNLMKL